MKQDKGANLVGLVLKLALIFIIEILIPVSLFGSILISIFRAEVDDAGDVFGLIIGSIIGLFLVCVWATRIVPIFVSGVSEGVPEVSGSDQQKQFVIKGLQDIMGRYIA